jgi:hypothetical protein
LVEKVEYTLNSLTDSSDEIFISVSKILNIWYSILINYIKYIKYFSRVW